MCRGPNSNLLSWLAAVAIALTTSAASAQLHQGLPNAPEPQLRLSDSDLTGAVRQNVVEGGITGDPDPAANPVEEPPIITIAPHPEDGRYWISGQANVIFQSRIPFHSPYEGSNSFRSSAEYKTSLVGTLFTALRRNRSVRYNTDFIFDV